MADIVPVPAGTIPPVPNGTLIGQGTGSGANKEQTAPANQGDSSFGLTGQTPGYVQPQQQQVPAGIDPAQYAAFLAYQASQVIPTATPVVPAPATQPAAPLVDATAALRAVTETGSDDPVLKSLTSGFVALGKDIDLNRAIGNAINLGKTELIDSAYIQEKGGDQAANLLAIAKGIVERTQQATSETLRTAHTEAGGESNWNAAIAAFNQQAPQHLKTVVSTLVNSGNLTNVAAAIRTVIDYARGTGSINTPGTFVQGAVGAGSASALSKGEFQAALVKLDRHAPNFAELRNDLFNRRQAGKAQGK